MSADNNKLLRRNHFYKSLLISSVFVTVAIVLVFMIVIKEFDDTATAIIERDNYDLFASLVERENQIDKSAVKMILGLSQTYQASTLKYTVFDEEEIHKSIKTLNLMLKYNIEALESCYVCNFLNGRIYLLGSRSGIYNRDNFFDQDILRLLGTMPEGEKRRLPAIARTFRDESGTPKSVYTYIFVENYDTSNHPADALVLNISIDAAYDNLLSDKTDLAILDNKGGILKVSGAIPGEEYLRLAASLPGATTRVEIGGKAYLAASASLNQNGWRIIRLSPIDNLTKPIRVTKYILIGILGAIIPLAILSSYTISCYLYTPIKKLMQKIPSTFEGDEFKAIQTYIKKKDEDLKKLNDKLAQSQPFIKTRLLANLLKSPMDEALLAKEVSQLSFNIPIQGRVGLIKIGIDDKYGFCSAFSSLEQMNMRNSLLNEMLEALDGRRCEYYYTNDYTNFHIVHAIPERGSDAEAENEIRARLSGPMESFRESTGYTISILLSQPARGLNDLHQAYFSLDRLEEELFFASPSSILVSSDIRDREAKELTDLPLKEISDALLGQRRSDFVLHTGAAFDTIAATDYYTASYLVQTLHHTILSAIRVYQNNSKNNLGLISSEHLEELHHFTFLSEIKQEIVDLGLQAIDMMVSIRGDEKNLLIERIDGFIRERYQDINLSSTMIADHFRLSAAYTNKLYRTATGDSLLNAINNFRLEKAAGLLRTTDMTVDEIAAAVGWDNVKYFYSKFKNFYGITPKEWRKS